MSTTYMNIIVVVMFGCFLLTNAANVTIPVGVHCDTYINYVKTSDHFIYHPYIVKLHRCAGRDIGHNNYGCIPKTSQDVNLKVTDIMERNYVEIFLKNVTSCEEVCLLNQSSCNQYQQLNNDVCQCKCKQVKSPPTCQPPFQWEKSLCDCICPIDAKTYICEKKKMFDRELCKCVCKKKFLKRCDKNNKMINPESCHCVDTPDVGKSGYSCFDGGVSKVAVCIIVIGEFVVIVIFFFLYKVYCDNLKKKFQRNSANTVDSNSCEKDEFALVEC